MTGTQQGGPGLVTHPWTGHTPMDYVLGYTIGFKGVYGLDCFEDGAMTLKLEQTYSS